MADQFTSTGDARAGNNAPGATRQRYRALSDYEKAQVETVKQFGERFVDLLHTIGGTAPEGARMASRDLSLAQTHIEDAVMRAVRHITG